MFGMKYFAGIVTHDAHLRYLQRAADTGTLPHAVLLWGPEGSGTLPAAMAMSQYLMCKERTTEGPCGVCKGCVKSAKHMHPDIHYAFPTIGTKVTGDELYPQWRAALAENIHMSRNEWLERIDAENKQGNINVEDCQRMIRQMSMHTFEADVKILIVWLPEYLGNAGNKLLKLIEEPPPDSYIILVAENRDEILPTILSRCQQLYFPPMSEETLRNALILHLGMDDEKASWIASTAQGNWNLALHLAQGTRFNPIAWAQEWVKAAWSQDAAVIYQWADRMSTHSREEHKQLLQYVLATLHKVFWLRYGRAFYAGDEEMKLIRFLNTKIEHQEMMPLIRLCEENLRAVQQNVNVRIVWYHLTMKMKEVLRMINAPVEMT